MTIHSTTAAPYAARPLEAARRVLQRHLRERARAGRPADGTTAPRVVALGAADVLRAPLDPAGAHHTATVHLTAEEVLIGPWGGTQDGGEYGTRACGRCLAMRRQRLRPRFEREALETAAGTPRAVAPWPLLSGFALDTVWAVYEAVVLAPHRPGRGLLPGGGQSDADLRLPQVSRVDLETLRVRSYPLLPEPLCPDCSQPDSGERRPDRAEDAVLRLSPRQKATPDSYRQRPPGSYPLPVHALANPVCGALGAATSADATSPITSPVVGSMLIRTQADFHEITWSGQSNSFESSRNLAFLEGLERYSGLHRRRGTSLLVESYANLGTDALDPRTCAVYPPETYRHDPAVTPFSADRKIPWIWGYSLRDDRPILVPARLVHYGTAPDHNGPDPYGSFVFETSSGCATGSCLEEAILFGLVELIERDAFLLGWYGAARLTELDLGSCGSRAVRAALDRATMLGYDVHVFDNRIDLAVPVVTSLAVRRDGGRGLLGFAAGAGLDPEAAVRGALDEVLTQIPYRRAQLDERASEIEAMAADFTTVRHLRDHAALFALPQMARHAEHYLRPSAVRAFDDVYRDWYERRPGSLDLLDDLALCRRELEQAGFDVIVVDQTSPEQERIGLRTVRAIVPGLLPIDFGWWRQRALGMERLRTAFRRAGRRSTDLTDAELHRVPHPFP